MNRRNFFSALVKGVGVFSILPPAETYARIWKATRDPIGIYRMLQELPPSFLPLDLETLFAQIYALKEKRIGMPRSDNIEIWCRPEELPLYA